MGSLICETEHDIQRRGGYSAKKRSHMNERKDAGPLKGEREGIRERSVLPLL